MNDHDHVIAPPDMRWATDEEINAMRDAGVLLGWSGVKLIAQEKDDTAHPEVTLMRKFQWVRDAWNRMHGWWYWDQGLCQGKFDHWASGSSREGKKLIALCEECPVRDICLDYAMKDEQLGVWGGTPHVRRWAEGGVRWRG